MKEADLQKAVIRFLKVAAPRLLVFHPANGGTRNVREAGNLKAQGVLPGVADLVFGLHRTQDANRKSPAEPAPVC